MVHSVIRSLAFGMLNDRLLEISRRPDAPFLGASAGIDHLPRTMEIATVGARVALAILSALSGDELHRAISSGDNAMVARAQGVGPFRQAAGAGRGDVVELAPGLAERPPQAGAVVVHLRTHRLARGPDLLLQLG